MSIVCNSVIKEKSLPTGCIIADCIAVHLHPPDLPIIIDCFLPRYILA